MANEFVVRNGLIAQNNSIVSGSLTVTQGITGSFTGSLAGTASWATNFVSAGNYVLNSQTSSFVQNTQTSSFVLNSQTSSMTAGTASNVSGGTGNYIPLWSTNTTLGSSGFYQNGNNIGLGLTNPGTPLHIKSTASPLMDIESTTSTAYSNIRFTGTGKKFTIGVGNASETLHGVANDFFIYDDSLGAMRMVVDTSGNVGIGTTGPTNKLEVNGGVTATSFTGTLQGTASFATTASFALNASAGGISQGKVVAIANGLSNLF